MANYAVSTSVTENKSYSAVVGAVEAVLEAVDTTKVIRLCTIVYNSGANTFVGIVVVDT